jgi:hypothetical protein
VRINDNRPRLSTPRDEDLRLEVAHLHCASRLLQFSSQSRDDRTFTRAIGAKNDDLQLKAFL